MKNKSIDLNGKWNFIADSQSKFEYEIVKDLFANNDKISQMEIPTNWELARLNDFNGTVWYGKNLILENEDGQYNLPILKFYGVDYFCEVWINDIKVGFHEGYFQEFYFNIEKSIKYNNNNFIVVKVTSPKEQPEVVWPLKKQLIKGIFNHHDCRPGGWSYEFGQDKNTGGIWNDVKIILCRNIYIERIKVTPKLINESTARINLNITYFNNSERQLGGKVKVSINKLKETKVKQNLDAVFNTANGELILTVDLPNPELWNTWDTGTPNLYVLKLSSDLFDTESVTFGIKTVELDEQKNFYLNGNKLFLRGTNIIPEQFLSSLTKARIQKLVTLIREANINIVRVHAHVNRKELYDEFDKQGVMLWQDFALQWTYEESTKFVSNAVSQIKDMVKQNYNHPSIAFWCCHNEPGEQIKTLDPFLYDAVLSEDSSRIIRMASNYEEHPYDGWYWGDKEHYVAAPMGPLVTEFGAQAIPEINTLKKFMTDEEINIPNWAKWIYHNYQYEQTTYIAKVDMGNNVSEYIENSQNYQSSVLRVAIENYRRNKNNGITGIFQFMFIDCWESITWSVVDYFGNKKKGYYELQKMYSPVIILPRVRQKEYLIDSFLTIDLWIVNDLLRDFKNLDLVFYSNDKPFLRFDKIDLKANEVLFFDWEKIKTPIKGVFNYGEQNVVVKLLDNGEILQQADFKIIVHEHKQLYNKDTK